MTDLTKWYELCLGIGAAQRPPSHYRLLDVRLFEGAPQVIHAGAERQAQRVRGWHAAIPSGALEALLAEIETARAVLADPDAREQYDRHLCASLFPPAIARPAALPARSTSAAGRRVDGPAEPLPRGSVLAQIMSLLRPGERTAE